MSVRARAHRRCASLACFPCRPVAAPRRWGEAEQGMTQLGYREVLDRLADEGDLLLDLT